MAKDIFKAQAANGDSTVFETHGAMMTFWPFGTFDGSTLKVEISPNGTDWFEPTELQWTSQPDKPMNLYVGKGKAKANLANAGGSSSVNLVVS